MDRRDVTDWMREAAAGMQDAELADAVATAADELEGVDEQAGRLGAGNEPDELTAEWPFECPHEEGSAGHALWEIAEAVNECTGDLAVRLDGIWALRDLDRSDPDWREAQAVGIEQELAHLTTLLQNAARIVLTLQVEEATDGS